MYKGFDELPDGHFSFLRHRVKMGKGDLWGQYLIMLFFAGLAAMFRLDDSVELPLYGRIIDAVLYSAVGLYIIPCFIFESKRLWNRCRRVKDMLMTVSWCFMEVLVLRLLLGLMLSAGNSLADLDGEAGYRACYIVAGALFLCGIALNVLFWRRMRRRTIAGEFRAKGSGFFGSSKFVMFVLCILIALCPAPATAAIRYESVGRLVNELFEDGQLILTIFGGIVVTFGVCLLTVLFAYLSCLYLADIYCFGRFGDGQQTAE